MPVQSARQHLGVARETTWGTGVTPTKYIPFDSFKAEEEIGNVVDNGKRGHLTADYNVIRTTKKATLDLESMLYVNEIGHFLSCVLSDVATTGSGPYVHTFKVGNTSRSLTVQHFNGYAENQYAGCLVDELTIKGDAEGVVTYTIKMQGKMATTVVTTSPTISAASKPLVGAFASLTVDGSPNTNLFGFEISLKRSNKLIFGANNTQDPTKAVQGTIEATFKLTFDVENGEEYAKYTDQGAHTFALALNGATDSKLTFTFSAAHVEKASHDDGDENVRVDWEGRGVYSVTDGGPCKIELTNTTATYVV